MARNPARDHDLTYLSADKADERGIIHRDLIAHAFRWSHVTRHVLRQRALVDRQGGAPLRVLDLGCGREAPLAATLYANRLTFTSYVGVDLGPISPKVKFNGAWQPTFLARTDLLALATGAAVAAAWAPQPAQFDLAVALEVAEHMRPAHLVRQLLRLRELASPQATFFLSTPNYDPRKGAADNHLNELTWATLKLLLALTGWQPRHVFGTFTDVLPAKQQLVARYGDAGQLLVSQLEGYFDTNVLSNILAPLLLAEGARNVLWELVPGARLDLDPAQLRARVGQDQDQDVAHWEEVLTVLGS